MALAEASFRMVMLWMRFMSISVTFSSVVSKPSRMNSGWLALARKLLFRPDASAASVEAPRICMEAMALGLEPASRLSRIIREGSRFLRDSTTLELDTRLISSLVMDWTEPVKLSLRRVKIPVTTDSSRTWESGSR